MKLDTYLEYMVATFVYYTFSNMSASTNILTCFFQPYWMLQFSHASKSIFIWFITTECLLPNLTHQNVSNTFLHDTSWKMNKDSKTTKDAKHCMLKIHFSASWLREIVLGLKDPRRRLITELHIVKSVKNIMNRLTNPIPIKDLPW
jgi:hypothetical protein